MTFRWVLFLHLAAALCGVGYHLFGLMLAGRAKRARGTPDEAVLMRTHLEMAPTGLIFLVVLFATGVWMMFLNDYRAMGGSPGWLHAKIFNVILSGILPFLGRFLWKARWVRWFSGEVTEEVRDTYRKTVMFHHLAALFIWINVFLGYWKPGH